VRLADLPTVERAGARWAVGTVADADPNDLREPTTALLETEDGPDVVAVVGEGDAPFLVIAATSAADVDAGEVVSAATETFGGGGGGGPTFAQGGGLDVDAAELVAWLREP